MSFLSGGGSGDRRPGIFDSFRGAFAPQQLPEDDGRPIVAPRSILIASALSLVCGVILAFLSVLGLTQLGSYEADFDKAVADYRTQTSQCVTDVGGFGSSLVIPPGVSDDQKARYETCQQYVTYSDADIASIRESQKTQNIVVIAVLMIIGLAAVAAGWFLRSGARWTRRTILGLVIVLLASIMLRVLGSILILGASLLLVVAVMLSFVGAGGLFFARHRARRAAS